MQIPKLLSDPIGGLAQGRWRFGLRQALIVLTATIIAMGGRDLLTPWLGTELPFVTAFVAVAIVGFFSGITTGAVTGIACAVWLAASWWPLHAEYEFGWSIVAIFIPAAFLVAFFSGQGRDEVATATAAAVDAAPIRHTVRALRLSMFIAVALSTVLFIGAAWIFYLQAFDDARLRVDREARIAQEHASKVLENNESMSRAVLDAVALMTPEEAVTLEREINIKLVQLAAGLRHVQSMWLLDRTGRAIASSRFFPAPKVDASDRDYFRWHQADRGGIYVSEPLVSRTQVKRSSTCHGVGSKTASLPA